jgi:hypothetical protein
LIRILSLPEERDNQEERRKMEKEITIYENKIYRVLHRGWWTDQEWEEFLYNFATDPKNVEELRVLGKSPEEFLLSRNPSIAIEYPYGSRNDSVEEEDGVFYYYSWKEVLWDQLGDDHDSRKNPLKSEQSWGPCSNCSFEMEWNPISLKTREDECWVHICSTECLFEFSGSKDPHSFEKVISLMEERAERFRKFQKEKLQE